MSEPYYNIATEDYKMYRKELSRFISQVIAQAKNVAKAAERLHVAVAQGSDGVSLLHIKMIEESKKLDDMITRYGND